MKASLPVAGLIGRENEFLDEGGNVRANFEPLAASIGHLGIPTIRSRAAEAQKYIRDQGANFLPAAPPTFFLSPGQERPIPYDPIPRLITAVEWAHLRAGIAQRAAVFNPFLRDVLNGEQTILATELVRSSEFYDPSCIGWRPANGVYVSLYGADIVRGAGAFQILEDNLAIAAGGVYPSILRAATTRHLPELFNEYRVQPVGEFRRALADVARELCASRDEPVMVYVTRGPAGVDFFESMHLAESGGFILADPEDIALAGGGDAYLVLPDGGRLRIDLIYSHLSPYFRLVHELPHVAKLGRVAVVNLPGANLLSDKAVFGFIPEMIRHYLGEEPILDQPPTLLLSEAGVASHVFANLRDYVVKKRASMGGKDVLIGPTASRRTAETWRQRVIADPLQYVAQEFVEISRHVGLDEAGGLRTCAVDLRMFAVIGSKVRVPTDVFSRSDSGKSGIVNVSSGGAMKDTWLLREASEPLGGSPGRN